METLNDRQYATLIEALSIARNHVKDRLGDDFPTPDIDSTQDAITRGITPATHGMRFELIQG